MLDKEGIKAAIREELSRKVAMSGGPEVWQAVADFFARLREGGRA